MFFGNSYFAPSYFSGSYFAVNDAISSSTLRHSDRGTRIEEMLYVGSNVFINTTTMQIGNTVTINALGYFGPASSNVAAPKLNANLILVGNNEVIITSTGIHIGSLTVNSSGVFINGAPIF